MNSESITVRLDQSKRLDYRQQRKHQYGAAIAELVVVLPVLLTLGLGILESALFYQAKTTVTYATFEAARKGATTHAQKGPMRDEFGLRIAPIFGGDGSGSKAQAAIGKGVVDAHNPVVTSIDIINPNSEAFLEFGVKNAKSGTIEIPNTHLRYRDPNIVGSESKVNVQDANLLKIQTEYGYQLKVPFVSQIITSVMKQFDPGNAVQFYNQGRIPITAVATVRMQSAAWEDGNLLADGTDPNAGDVGNGAAGEPGGQTGEGGENGGASSLNPTDGQGGSTPDPFGPGTCPANTSCGTGDPSQQCSVSQNSGVGLTSAQAGLPSKEVGNPINVVSGNKYQYEDDFPALPGALGLAWGRHYNSQSHSKSGLGVGWQHLFDVRAKRIANDRIRIVQADGRQIVFEESEPGKYISLMKSDGWISVSDDTDFNIKNRMSWHWPNGKLLRFTQRGALSDINLPTGEWLKLQYNDANKLILVKDPQDRQISLGYYPNGRLKNVLDPLGKPLRYRYDSVGNLASVTFADGGTKHYHYEDKRDPSNLTGITDQRGVRFASWSYDARDRAITSEHAEGVEAVSIAYADDGSRLVTNSLQEVSTYFTELREGMGVVTAIQGPGCSSCGTGDVNYEYNEQLQLVRSKQVNGQATIREYDAYGRTTLIKQQYSDGSEQLLARYEYDTPERNAPSTIFKSSVNPDGLHSYSLAYNDDEQLVEMLEQGWTPTEQGEFELQKRRTQLRYANGLLIALDGPQEDVDDTTHIYYDAKRRLQKLQTPDGRILAVKAYDDYGRPIEIQQGRQQAIEMAYNQRGDVTSIKQRGQTTQYQYDAVGQLIQVIGPDGESMRIAYDAAGRASEVTGPNGRQILTELDSEGTVIGNQLLSEQGGVLAQISYLYDAEGRLSQIQRNGETSQSREYDGQGNLANTTDAAGNQTAFNYSSLGELLAITQPNSNVTRLSYDAKHNVKTVTDARNNNTEYAYNDFGQLVRSRNPDTGVQQYAYDLAGNQLQKTDARGATTHYEYDAANRMTHRGDADGSIFYHYDLESGRLASVEGPNSRETFAYNRDAQLIEHTRTFNEKLTFTTRYSYSSQGKILSKELPDGQRLVYHYHESGNRSGTLKAITRDDLIGQTTIIGELNTNDTATIETYTHGNGLEVSKETDGLGTAVALSFGETLALNYQYDELGRIVGIDENTQENRFDYDSTGQLLGAHTALGRFEYEYDEVGNRTRKTHSVNDQETEEHYTYANEGEGNRLLAVNGEARDYNDTGSPKTTSKFRYEYNAQQRPVKVFDRESNTLIAQYQYNSFGARIKKVAYKHSGNTSRKTITYYLYDGRKLAAEISEDGDVLAQYLYYKGQVVAKLQNRDVFAVHTDHLGTPKAVTDQNKSVVWSAEYTPFGEASVEVGDITLNLRLPGQYFDAETGTHYNYYRDYDPAIGRYQQSDPIGLAGGVNTYAYVTNNPLQLTDILGLAPNATGAGPEPGTPEAEEAYERKLDHVLDKAIERFSSPKHAGDLLGQIIKDLKSAAPYIAGVLIALGAASAFVAATGVGAVGLAAVGTGLAVLGWAALGWDGLRYIYDVFKIIREIDNYEESDCAGLDSLADKLYDRTVQLESVVIQELTGAKIGDLISKLARRIKGSKGDADTTRPTDNQSCSFAGNTIVLSRRGAVPIQDLVAGNDEVWAREEATGTMGWQPVLSHYHNTYDSTVAVSIRSGLGVEQIIESNEIHPYFARLPEGSKAPTSNSEGHDYDGSMDRGHWVDAINLQPGYQLLGSDGNWQSVVGVMIRPESLKAFNLTVANYNTYFVAGNDDARGVWVHNKCWDELDDLPKGTEPKGKNDFGQDQFEGPDGRIIYKGEDGRYYDAIDHPPGPKRNPEGPLADGYERDGKDIVGPEGGRYTDVGTDRNGNGVYKDKDGNFYTLKDGKPHYNPDRFRTGLTAERLVTKDLDEKGWERVGGTADDNVSGTIDADIPGYQGQQGIDGIYKRKNPQTGETEYLVVETKGSTTNNAGPMSNTKDGNQLSKKWIDNRIGDESKGGLSGRELREFNAAKLDGNVSTLKAEVTNVKAGKTVNDSTGDINYKAVSDQGDGKVALGDSYDPGSSV